MLVVCSAHLQVIVDHCLKVIIQPLLFLISIVAKEEEEGETKED